MGYLTKSSFGVKSLMLNPQRRRRIMPRKIKINIGGVDYDGQEVSFKILKEDWNEYELYDGGIVRLKTSAQKIVRVLDAQGKPAFTPEGDPHVLVRHNTQVVTSI
jgi:hypothetical protein